jgi:hypothetical protein
VNRLLKGVPVKVVEGYISEVRLRIDTKAMKISVVVGKVSLITYMDDHSQFTSKNENGENYVVDFLLAGSRSAGGELRHWRRPYILWRLL